jgi:ketosteroid isomerase-like protein
MEINVAQSDLATVQRFYELLARNNFEEANRLLADDVVFHETTDLPYGGDYHGVAGITDLMGRVAAVAELSVVRVDYLSEENPVVAHVVARFASKATGVVIETDVIEIVHVRDGRITEMDIYYKNPAVVAALWPQQ